MFDMPKEGSWEIRAGWVVRELANDLDWPLASAAALCGNFGVESIEFTAFQEIGPRSGRGGVGWGQWTGVRRRNFEKWAQGNGLDLRSDEASYGFTVFEFSGADETMEPGSDFKPMAIQLRGHLSLENATHLIHEWYERPQEALDGTFKSGPKRLEYARRALEGAESGGSSEAPGFFPRPVPAPAISHPMLRLTPPPTTGAEVKKLQTLLLTKGFDPGPVDGVFGTRTDFAVQTFQRHKSLTVDGIVGPRTWAKLEERS